MLTLSTKHPSTESQRRRLHVPMLVVPLMTRYLRRSWWHALLHHGSLHRRTIAFWRRATALTKPQILVVAEVEYSALVVTTCEVVWLHNLLNELQIKAPSPALLFGDNQVVIYIANNPTFHEITKHIELDCHFVRDRIIDGSIKLLPVRSSNQLAEIFTKPPLGNVLFSLINNMGVQDIFSDLEEEY